MKQEHFEILLQALQKSEKSQDIPVSSLILDDEDQIVGVGWNTRNEEYEISSHAEINALNKVTKKIKSLNLNGYTLLTTLEPCQMCYGAIKQSKIKKVEYLLDSQKYGIHNNYSINDINLLLVKNSTMEQEKKYQQIMENFFKKLR